MNKDLRLILEYHTEAEKNKPEFLKLLTAASNKQIFLLVGNGTEGWNCKSLVATALFRKPKSSVFVLQSTTRCLGRWAIIASKRASFCQMKITKF
ncbi:MAG: hypothetical protein A2X78_03410 [Gammaproteobacteria bacterium GWE2_37_16]|nr:MAG: hypothetical protein A2X78_03410 [Gammaproteobacteria bacterium GWE2_37_16]